MAAASDPDGIMSFICTCFLALFALFASAGQVNITPRSIIKLTTVAAVVANLMVMSALCGR